MGEPTTPRHDPAHAFTARTGVVTTFDDHLGAGTVTDDATGEHWYLHCTRLADGTRTIATGTAVRFRAEPGPTGLEAVAVAPLGVAPGHDPVA